MQPRNTATTGKTNRRRRLYARFGGALCAAIFLSLSAACSSSEEKLEKYTHSGETYLEQGDLGRANIQFQNALKIDEENVPALEGLAKIAEKKNDFKGMYGLLERVVRLQPDNVEAHVKLGKLLLIGSDEASALEHAEKALAVDPDNIGATALKAAIQLKVGDKAGAVELARRVLDKDPANPEAVTVIVTERSLAGDNEAALAELDRALKIKPDIAVLQLLRISILTALGRDEEVIAGYDNLIKLFPDEPAYRRIYATDLIRRKNYGGAAKQLEKVVELAPGSLDAKLDVVRVLMKGGDEEAAGKKLQAYVDANPDNADLKFAMAEFLRKNGDADGSASILGTLSHSDDMDVALKAKNLIAANDLANGKRKDAEKLIDEILAADERNTNALIKRAGLKITDGDYDAAVLDLRTALDNDPDSAEAMVLMALAFEKQDNAAFASSEFAKAFEASGKGAKIANAFAKFQLRQKNSKRAEEILTDSLAAHAGDLDNLKLLAAIRLSRKDWRGAEEVSDIIDKLKNQDALADNIRAAAYAGLGEYDKIIESLSENSATPLASRPLSTLVAAYLRSDRAADAEQLLKQVIASDDKNYPAHILLAQVYGAEGKKALAEQTLVTATENDPSRAEAYELLYSYYVRDGQDGKAEALIKDGLAKAPDNKGLQVIRADSLLTHGKLEEAFSIYSDLIKDQPENKIIVNNFVSLSSDLRQDAASAARALEAAKVLEKEDNPLFKDTVGWAYYRAGDFDKAVEFLSVAAKGASENAEILYHLGAAYYASGDMEKAKATLEDAMAKGGDGFRYADEIRGLLGRM